MNKQFGPSEEQIKIINEPGNLVVTARPGSGKTFTIVEKIKCISEALYDYQGIIAISFTQKASYELESRCRKKNTPMKRSFYGTIDKFYINQIICPFAKHLTRKVNIWEVKKQLDEDPKYRKLINIREKITPELEELLIESLAEGHIFLEICGETAFYILTNVRESMEYLSARYTHIFIDEYQDCGAIQHKLFLRLVNEGIIGVAVGDLDQAIYAFINRDPKYLSALINDARFNHFEITKNYRCHKSISNYSLKLIGVDVERVDDLRVFKVDIDGSEKELMAAIDKYIPQIKRKYGVKYNNEIAILCVNNATATKADSYLKTPSKLFSDTKLDKDNSYWARLFADFLESYFAEDIFAIDFVERYINEETHLKDFYKGIEIIKCLFEVDPIDLINYSSMIIDFANLLYPEHKNRNAITLLIETLGNEKDFLTYKPAGNNEVCVLTLHKAKGLEFKIVFHLDLYKWILPWEGIPKNDYVQSLNLHYVGITRAMEACYLMQGSVRYRDAKKDLYKTVESPFLHLNGLSSLRRNVIWSLK